MTQSGKNGFTLIELLIAMIVLAILSVLAYPSYHNSIRKSRRVDAQQALMKAANKLENYYAKNASYTANLKQLGYPETEWNNVQSGSKAIYYQIRISNPDGCSPANCYVVESRNAGDQENDVVNRYRLWSTGRRQVRVGEQNREGW